MKNYTTYQPTEGKQPKGEGQFGLGMLYTLT